MAEAQHALWAATSLPAASHRPCHRCHRSATCTACDLLVLIESILAGTGRTVRAVVLIVTVGLVTGTVPGVQVPAREPAGAVVRHVPTP